MKTYKNLYPQITDFTNLYLAYHRALARQAGSGCSRCVRILS